MKILKIILGIIVVVVGLFFVYLFTLPDTYKVERSIVIKASPELVMEHIANFGKWEKWSPWRFKDPNALYTFEGPEYGVGAKMSWEGNDSIGVGSMEISELQGNELMKYELKFIKPWEMGSRGSFIVSQEEGGTKVSWSDEGDLGLLMRPMGAMMDAMIGPDFDKGLDAMKTHVEMEAENTSSAVNFPIEELTIESFYYIAIQDTCAVADVGPKMDAMLGKVMEYATSSGITPAGYPFAIYHSWGTVGTRFTTGVPVAKEQKGEGDIKGGVSYSGNVLKVKFMGPYEGTEQVHESIGDYADKNGKEIVGAPWEVYVTDPSQEPDTSKWITEIYYPVK